ncbi:helix-turn-helix domain-containing protein [Haloarcula sp. S1CR25-12]|uniref:Helix-turn-helix domain-containing protein n=1 Tax=Haloarcula saliterrae TaxID=2950534 RepID=A0ABU2F8Q1_9EURY|nr:helix-turn-helix domain-containing protein [Haloarcula sp. S1CR25-12]MDS0258181.1 helix-turn-helix domain-containing protein [Haloarcula sp. S1CR25-12]
MPRAKLTLAVPEDSWVHEVSTADTELTVKVHTVLAHAQVGVAVVELTTADPVSALSALDDHADVADVDLLATREDSVLLQVETTSPALVVPLWQAGVPVELPFSVRNGDVTWTVLTSADRLAALGQALDEAGIDYELTFARDIDGRWAARVMTDRQREVLLAALEMGYYATPREATLTEVAAHLDISKATCSDILHRAEGNLVTRFAAEALSR